MVVINVGSGRVKLVAETPHMIRDKRTQRTYYEVICKETQKRFFVEAET